MWVWGAIAAVASIYGAVTGAEAAEQAGKSRADAARANAKYLKEQAQFADQLGANRQLQYENQATRFRSQQQGLFAKAGVDLVGSALQKLGESSSLMEQQLRQIEWTTNNEVRFANLKASNLMDSAADIEGAIASQQGAIWAQGIAGAAQGISMMSKSKGSGMGSMLTGFKKFGTSSWDYVNSWSNLSLGG